MSEALILERRQLHADLETRTNGVDHWRKTLAEARKFRDADIVRGAAVLSQDRAERAERNRRYLVAIGGMSDDSDERASEVVSAFVANRPRGMGELTAQTLMQALSDAAEAAVDAENGTRAPVAPLAGYADEAALQARIDAITKSLGGA